MSLLSIVQQVASKVLGTLPSSLSSGVISSGDQAIQTIIGLVNEEGQETSNTYTWQALRNEATFSTGGNQGGILSFGTLTPGSGYNGGNSQIFNNVPLTGGTGTGATATFNVSSGVVASCTIFPPTLGSGSGYVAGDVLSVAPASLGGPGGAGFSIQVATVGLVGIENQGSLLTLCGPDFNFIVDETIWDRTTRRPVFGPKSPQEWQQLKAQLMQGPWYQYTIRGNNFLMIPPPAQGDTIYFEWITKYWCTNAAGTVGQLAMVADTDVSKIDETVITLGAIWRFRKGKGLSWQVDYDKWQDKIGELTTRDGAKARINLAGVQSDIYPGIIVPSGNWPISGEPY